MTDRELLELAAKAAGVDIHWNAMVNGLEAPITKYVSAYEYDEWNPLTDDGDALRLAVKLGMMINVGSGGFCTADIDGLESSVNEVATPNPYAATRRAIVRAAASIGKEMK